MFIIIEANRDDLPDAIQEHKEDIVKLRERNLSLYFKNRFEWLYYKNPYGTTKTWLAAESDKNRVIACGSVYPRKLFMDKDELRLGIAIDFAVDKEFRVFGPALKIQRHIIKHLNNSNLDVIFALPDKAAKGVFRRAGYLEISKASTFIKILRSSNKIHKFLRISFLTNIISSLLDYFLMAYDLLEFRFLNVQPMHIEQSNYFDERVDKLCEEPGEKQNQNKKKDLKPINRLKLNLYF